MTQQPWAGYNPPQQQYGGPQQAMGYPPQQQQQAPVVPTPDAATMFDNIAEALIAPSFQFGGAGVIGTYIQGEVVRTRATNVTDLDGNVKFYPPRPGQAPQAIPQLNVVLQTDLRNWDNVKQVPTERNPDGSPGAPLPPSEDTGLRQIYVKYDMMRAVGIALREAGVGAGVGVQNGGHLAVAKTGERPPRRQGDNPLPLYQAKYTKPAVSDTPAFDFSQVGQQQQAPTPQYDQGGQLPQGQVQQGPPQGEQVQGPPSPWQGPPAPPAPDSPWGGQPTDPGKPPF